MKRIIASLVLAATMVLLPAYGYSATIAISWDPPNTNADGTPLTDLAGFRIYVDRNEIDAYNLQGYLGFQEVGANTTLACIEVDDTQYPGVFFAVTAYDTSGNESDPAIGWALFGNIYGTFNDGVPWGTAVVDIVDWQYIWAFYGMNVQKTDYCPPKGNSKVEIPSITERADLNNDGRIDYLDNTYLLLHFGNRLP